MIHDGDVFLNMRSQRENLGDQGVAGVSFVLVHGILHVLHPVLT